MSIQILCNCLRPLQSKCMWNPLSSILRFKSKKVKCAEYTGPECSKEELEKIKPCPAQLRDMDEDNAGFKSMWENPECCNDPCPEYIPRYDELYYKSTDKLNRTYQQTWAACPALKMRQKKVCSFEKLMMPPAEKRGRKQRPKTACPVGGSKICTNKLAKKCTKINLPGCMAARTHPKCHIERSISNCAKECAPYPSYSECLREKESDAPPIECKCLDHPSMCEVWAEMRRRLSFVKG